MPLYAFVCLNPVELLIFFQIGGGIYWDYHISSVPVNTDKSFAYTILSFASMVLLALNILSEISGLQSIDAVFLSFESTLVFKTNKLELSS
jgi:hypothetical protein